MNPFKNILCNIRYSDDELENAAAIKAGNPLYDYTNIVEGIRNSKRYNDLVCLDNLIKGYPEEAREIVKTLFKE